MVGCGGGSGGPAGAPPPSPPPPPPLTSHFLTGESGANVTSSLQLASGARAIASPHRVAIDPLSPSTPIPIETAGQYVWLADFPQYRSSNASNGSFSGQIIRYTLTLRTTGLFRHDLLRGATGLPPARRLSTLMPSDICQPFPELVVHESNPDASMVIFQAPGIDGICETADDDSRAIRLDMQSTDNALAAPRVLNPIGDITTGITNGWLVRSGNQLLRTNASFQGATPLGVTMGSDFALIGILIPRAGSSAYYALFRNNHELRTINLSTFAIGPSLLSLAANSQLRLGQPDATHDYLAVAATTTTDILRIDARNPVAFETVTTELHTAGSAPLYLWNLGSRLVWGRFSDGAIRSVPKTGATNPTPIYGGFGTGLTFLSAIGVVGNNVFFESSGSATGYRTGFINADGSGLQEFFNSRYAGAGQDDPQFAAGPWRYVIIAQGVSGDGQFRSTTLNLYDATTRSLAVSYGTLPAVGYRYAYGEFQFGQPALLVAADLFRVNDLFFLNSDRPGLTRVTSNLVAQAAVRRSTAIAPTMGTRHLRSSEFGASPVPAIVVAQ